MLPPEVRESDHKKQGNLFIRLRLGTSNFRLKLVGHHTVTVLECLFTGMGIKRINVHWSKENSSWNRTDYLLRYLKSTITQLERKTGI